MDSDTPAVKPVPSGAGSHVDSYSDATTATSSRRGSQTSISEVLDPVELGEVMRVVTGTFNSDFQASLADEEQTVLPSGTRAFPHTIFTKVESYCLAIFVAMIGFCSTVSAPIYLPVIPVLEEKFNVSTELINLTVFAYSMFQGIGPALVGPFSDLIGRRPSVLSCLFVYLGANIGLAVTNTYWLLFLLRCIQAFGIGPTVAIGSAVVGDITTRANRGSMIGLVSGISLIGGTFGPLIGGVLETWLGWRAIFWFLAIVSGTVCSLSLFLMPETRRSIVGNGSIRPKWFFSRAPIMYARRFYSRTNFRNTDPDVVALESKEKKKDFRPFLSFYLLRFKEVCNVLFSASLHYSCWLCLLTAMSTLLDRDYHMDILKISLCYLAPGIGSLSGSLSSGFVQDKFYAFQMKKHKKAMAEYRNLSPKEQEASSKPEFNIYKARLFLCILPSFLSSSGTIIFGWTIGAHVCLAVPLICGFFVSFGMTYYVSMSTVLLVDLFPHASSAATGSVNITRCCMGAFFVIFLDRMIKSMTVGGCFTFLGGVTFMSNILVYWEVYKGPQWHKERVLLEIKREENRKKKVEASEV